MGVICRVKCSACMIAGLPRQENTKIDNIHFCCCSDVVSALDMTGPLAQELTDLNNWN